MNEKTSKLAVDKTLNEKNKLKSGRIAERQFFIFIVPDSSVGDLYPDPAGFWASWIRILESEVQIRILPFSHKGIERTEIMLVK